MTDVRYILALDAATEACSAALQAGQRYAERYAVVPRGHARHLIGMVDELLEEAGLAPDALDLVVYGRGPGAFTGVRIGVGVAQGLAFGAGCPVHGVSTLEAVAQGCHRRTGATRVLVAMDARMGEVYWSACTLDADSGLMRALREEQVSAPEAVRCPSDWPDWVAAGTGWAAYPAALEAACGAPAQGEPEALPSALDMLPFGAHALRSGDTQPAEGAQPVYLRDKVTG